MIKTAEFWVFFCFLVVFGFILSFGEFSPLILQVENGGVLGKTL